MCWRLNAPYLLHFNELFNRFYGIFLRENLNEIQLFSGNRKNSFILRKMEEKKIIWSLFERFYRNRQYIRSSMFQGLTCLNRLRPLIHRPYHQFASLAHVFW